MLIRGIDAHISDRPNPTRPDATLLVFPASEMPLYSDDWFMAGQVVEVFVFFERENFLLSFTDERRRDSSGRWLRFLRRDELRALVHVVSGTNT